MDTDKIGLTIQKCHDCSSIRAELLEMKSGLLDSIADLTAKFESHDKTFKQFLLNFGVNFESADSQEGELSNESNSDDFCDNGFSDIESPSKQSDQLASIINEPDARDHVDQTMDLSALSKPVPANTPSEMNTLPESASEEFLPSKRVKIEVDEESFATTQPLIDNCLEFNRLPDEHPDPGEVAWNCLSSSPSQQSAASATAFVTSRNADFIRPVAGFGDDFSNFPFGQGENSHFNNDCDAPGGSFNLSGCSPRRKASRNNKHLQNKLQNKADEHLLSVEQLFAVTNEYSSARLLEESSLCSVSSDNEANSMFQTDKSFLSSATDANIYNVAPSAEMRLSVMEGQSTSGHGCLANPTYSPTRIRDLSHSASRTDDKYQPSAAVSLVGDSKMDVTGGPIHRMCIPAFRGLEETVLNVDKTSLDCQVKQEFSECEDVIGYRSESCCFENSQNQPVHSDLGPSEPAIGAGQEVADTAASLQVASARKSAAGRVSSRDSLVSPRVKAADYYRHMVSCKNACLICRKRFSQRQVAYRHVRNAHMKDYVFKKGTLVRVNPPC